MNHVSKFKKKKGGDDSVWEKREKMEKGFFHFSLRSMEIRLTDFVRARGKVHPRIESYVWVPKSRTFVKLHEVGNFHTWNIYNLKVI